VDEVVTEVAAHLEEEAETEVETEAEAEDTKPLRSGKTPEEKRQRGKRN